MFDRKRLEPGQRRELIMEAALRLFAERGYHGVSLDEIAAAAGVTKPVVYDHAVSKEDLYSGLLERQHEELLAHIVAHLEATGPLEKRVRSALHTLFNWASDNPSAWQLLFSDDTTGDRYIASIHKTVQRRANREVAKRVLPVTDATSKQTEFRLEMIGEILGGATRSLIRWWHDHSDVPKTLLVETLMGVVWNGMATAVAESEPSPDVEVGNEGDQ